MARRCLRRQGAASRPGSIPALEDWTSRGSAASWSRRPARYSTTRRGWLRKTLDPGGCCDHRENPRTLSEQNATLDQDLTTSTSVPPARVGETRMRSSAGMRRGATVRDRAVRWEDPRRHGWTSCLPRIRGSQLRGPDCVTAFLEGSSREAGSGRSRQGWEPWEDAHDTSLFDREWRAQPRVLSSIEPGVAVAVELNASASASELVARVCAFDGTDALERTLPQRLTETRPAGPTKVMVVAWWCTRAW